MIVQCDKCETKFRIADAKVTGGGVKVRCSKCAHVFVVRKDGVGLAEPAGTPNLSFGEVAGPTVKVSPDTIAAFAAGSMAPNLNRAPTVPLSPRSIPPPASTQEVAAALGFGSAPPQRAPVPAFTTHADQPRPIGMPSAVPSSMAGSLPTAMSSGLPAFPDHTKKELPTFPDASSSNDRFPEPRPLSEVKTEQLRLPQKRDPFHDLAPTQSSGEMVPKLPSSPGSFAPPNAGGLIEPFPKIPSGVTDPFQKIGSEPGGHNPFAKSGADSGGYNPFAKAGSETGGHNPFGKIGSQAGEYNPFAKIGSQAGDPNPFGKIPTGSGANSFLDAPTEGNAKINPFLSPDPFGGVLPNNPDPFADANILAPPPMSARPDSNPFQNPPAPGPDMLQRGTPKNDPVRTTFFPPPANFNQPRSNDSVIPVDVSDHDPFANIDVEVPSHVEPAEDQFFDALSSPPPPRPAEPLARIQFGSAVPPSAQAEVSHAKTAVAAAYREEVEQAEASIGVWPTAIGVALGLIIALFVFPGLIGDWMDLQIGTELIQPKKLLPESLDQLSAMGARVTSYDGKNGARMLVVSGSAKNDGTEKLDNVQAVVLMLEGDEIIERRRSFVGVTLDEATLAGVENASELESAYRTAKQSAPPEQLEIAPGANARFVVVFPAIPENIETRKFRVEFVKAPVESAKKTEPTP